MLYKNEIISYYFQHSLKPLKLVRKTDVDGHEQFESSFYDCRISP